MRYQKWHHGKAWPRQFRDSRWNFVAMCSRIRDMPAVSEPNLMIKTPTNGRCVWISLDTVVGRISHGLNFNWQSKHVRDGGNSLRMIMRNLATLGFSVELVQTWQNFWPCSAATCLFGLTLGSTRSLSTRCDAYCHCHCTKPSNIQRDGH